MSVPIIGLDARLRQFRETFRHCFSQPQFKYLVTVLLRQVADGQRLSGMSRFLSQSPWSAAEVAGAWTERFQEQLSDAVAREHECQRRSQTKCQ